MLSSGSCRRALPAASQAPPPLCRPHNASQRAYRQRAKRSAAPPSTPVRERSGGAASAQRAWARRADGANPSSAALRGSTAPGELGARRHVFRVLTRPRIRSRNVSAPSALAVASGLGVAAVAYSSGVMRPPALVERWAAWRASRSPATSKSPNDCWATRRGGDRAGCRVRRRTSARLRRAEVLKAISAQSQSLYTTTAPARLRGVTRLIWDRKNGKITLLAAFRLGSISDRVEIAILRPAASGAAP